MVFCSISSVVKASDAIANMIPPTLRRTGTTAMSLCPASAATILAGHNPLPGEWSWPSSHQKLSMPGAKAVKPKPARDLQVGNGRLCRLLRLQVASSAQDPRFEGSEDASPGSASGSPRSEASSQAITNSWKKSWCNRHRVNPSHSGF